MSGAICPFYVLGKIRRVTYAQEQYKHALVFLKTGGNRIESSSAKPERPMLSHAQKQYFQDEQVNGTWIIPNVTTKGNTTFKNVTTIEETTDVNRTTETNTSI